METSNVTFKIARCDPYPLIDPQGYVVGFIAYHTESGHSIYKDVFVSFVELMKEAKNAQEECDKDRHVIIDMAFEKIRVATEEWGNSVTLSHKLLGSQYTPKSKPVAQAIHDQLD
jgi:hypothetical protein